MNKTQKVTDVLTVENGKTERRKSPHALCVCTLTHMQSKTLLVGVIKNHYVFRTHYVIRSSFLIRSDIAT